MILAVASLSCSVAARPVARPLLAFKDQVTTRAEQLRILTLEVSSEFAQVIEVTAESVTYRKRLTAKPSCSSLISGNVNESTPS